MIPTSTSKCNQEQFPFYEFTRNQTSRESVREIGRNRNESHDLKSQCQCPHHNHHRHAFHQFHQRLNKSHKNYFISTTTSTKFNSIILHQLKSLSFSLIHFVTSIYPLHRPYLHSMYHIKESFSLYLNQLKL